MEKQKRDHTRHPNPCRLAYDPWIARASLPGPAHFGLPAPRMALKNVRLIKKGKRATLGKVYQSDAPFFGTRGFNLTIPGLPTGGPFGKHRLVYNDEMVTTEIGQAGTQFDGPGHIGIRTLKGGSTAMAPCWTKWPRPPAWGSRVWNLLGGFRAEILGLVAHDLPGHHVDHIFGDVGGMIGNTLQMP